MRNHTLNLFKVNNLSDLNFSYKLVEFNLPYLEGQEDRFNKQLQKISQQVALLSGGPAALIKRENRYWIAIPADKIFEETSINVVPYNIRVSLLPDVYQVNASSIDKNNVDVIYKFLDFEIRKQLSRNLRIWKLNSSQFFLKQPIVSRTDSIIDIYEGFSYKLVLLHGSTFYICIDLSTKYVDRHVLSYYVNTGNVQTIGNSFKGKRFLYLNGDNWYATELEGFGEDIQSHEFNNNGDSISVYNYILNNARTRKEDIKRVLKPSDLTILYKYPGRTMEPHSGACSLAKMLYSTQDKEVQSLHRYSIKDPNIRFEAIGKYIREYFQNIRYGNIALKISLNPLVEKVPNFSMPELKYNNDRTLKAGHYSNGANTTLREFAGERKHLLIENGVINKSMFDEQFLIVPDSMDRKLVEAFKKNAEHQIKALAPAFTSFTVIRYPVRANQAATFQIQEIEHILRRQNALNGFALFVLPDMTSESPRSARSFHDCLKNQFYPDLKVQCASAYKINSFFRSFPNAEAQNMFEYRVPEDKKPKFKSYLTNLVLEHLIVNRKWPYALSKNLHYDIYIGIDVHDRYAGFTFFFKNGENIFFFPEQVPLKNRSQRSEKLKANLLNKVIYEKLKMFIPKFCPTPNGIVIIRDGRSFGEENKALSSVISSLATDGLVDLSQIKYSVIDLHKQSAVPLRIASHTNGFNKLENPIAGAFKKINETEAFLYNTGFPFQIRGSAKPLHLTQIVGNTEFPKVIEDIFCQSILAFSAPDRSNSLPITIKLIDTLLEPLSGAIEGVEEEEEFEDSLGNY
ncbi:hypothetical protein GA0116948_101600 [Chitinophaga costaii]|uniref:Piwi domain-containing protein n=1 Tax=Chitinophaga costaii TaxID=1335309 RepID=A0A1C3ZXN2_9BACT|nr:hypothetical protein [Chitinophaga costaii]PUZ30549.1 hypothetical protein DCM91_03535 [Chitinophaga costaii]SCB87164.1 hypothetical protein GA0116948_101600 [Chitinophaga costaii]